MKNETFERFITLLKFNYGQDYYQPDFVAELFVIVFDVDDNFFEQEIRKHLKRFQETKDRPKIAAFEKIKVDYRRELRMQEENQERKEWMQEPRKKGILDLGGHKTIEEFADAGFQPKEVK